MAAFFVFWILLSTVSFANECLVQEFKQFAEELDKTQIEDHMKIFSSIRRIKNEAITGSNIINRSKCKFECR